MTALLLVSACLLFVSACVSFVPDDGMSYLEDVAQPLDLAARGAAVGSLGIPTDARVYLLGESHGIATNDSLDMALFTYLYETSGVRTYIAEVGYSAGRFYDEYVQTGDERVLDGVFSSLRGLPAWSRNRYEFWQELAAFNMSRPEGEGIRVVGLDVEHQYAVGISYIAQLFANREPAVDISEAINEVRLIVEERAWSITRCSAAAGLLGTSLQNHPEAYRSVLGDDLADFERAVAALVDGFAYRAESGKEAEAARDRSMHNRFVAVRETTPGGYYGKFGAEHIYQRPYRGIVRLGALLDDSGSPVTGRVVSILLAYEDAQRLTRDRTGAFVAADYESKRRLLQPLLAATESATAADGNRAAGTDTEEARTTSPSGSERTPPEAILFSLADPASRFAEGLYLLEAPTAKGVTTDYIQGVVLLRGARAATLLDRTSQ